jgi:leucyl aminopeptidase (aminopeptidase T)
LGFQIINELALNPATCQQLANTFGLSKQKIHYNLKNLLNVGLIKIANISTNDKEVYYQAKAKNYIIDFSLGVDTNEVNQMKSRKLINTILEKNYNINLSKIAANLLENALKMKAKEKLLIVTGEYNMPLVRKILVEASKRQIDTTLLYRDKELLEAKHNQFSLATYNWDFEKFNKLLKEHNVYLYLNGESRFIPLDDPQKRKLQQKAFVKSREIIQKNNIRVAMMQGLMNDTISENNITSEISFWKSLDIDYEKLANETDEMAKKFMGSNNIEVENEKGSDFTFKIEKTLCEYGAFTNSPMQSPIINIPGGEVLFIPQDKSFNGIIKSEVGYIYGKKITNPTLKILDNKIVYYQAEENEALIKKAIREGGPDGRKIALISIGTNYNMNVNDIDPSYKNKSKEVLTIYWGNNVSLGGNVKGLVEMEIQLKKAKIKK